MSWRGTDDERVFVGPSLCISLKKVAPGEWRLNCIDARVHDYLVDEDSIEQAERTAINVVSDRLVWLMRGWVRELKIDLREITSSFSDRTKC